jgi:hypothetical protein
LVADLRPSTAVMVEDMVEVMEEEAMVCSVPKVIILAQVAEDAVSLLARIAERAAWDAAAAEGEQETWRMLVLDREAIVKRRIIVL